MLTPATVPTVHIRRYPPPMPKRAVVIESDEMCPAGFVAEAATNSGYTLDRIVVNATPDVFPQPEDIDLLIITGSEEHWYEIDEYPHLDAEFTFIRSAIVMGARVFGMCFGGQALALALGGTVSANRIAEIGWVSVETNDPDLVPPGPWFEWHEDGFTLPPGAELLAWNDFGPQAFFHGPHLGLQFHPELTPEMLAGWAPDLPTDVDAAALMQETASEADGAKNRAFALFKMFESLQGTT